MAKKNIKRLFALVLAVSMVMSLSVNAFAMDGKDAICGKETHAHNESCFEAVLVCDAPAETLVCETEIHEHVDECFTSHAHEDACFEIELVCEAEEHIHEDACYAEEIVDEEIVDEEIIDEEIVDEEIFVDEELFEEIAPVRNRIRYSNSRIGTQRNEVSKDKTAEWADDEQTIADVTLSVPGDVEVVGADIVFAIDKSSCEAYATTQLNAMFNELVETQKKSDASIKVGVVVFNYTDHTDVPLTELTAENAETLLSQITKRSGGTNIEAGLLTAKEMLDADKTVPAKNKYVILISDGLTWAYDDENGDPQTILWKNGKTAQSGIMAYGYTRNNSETNMNPPNGYSWDEYWAQIKEWVEADGDTYSYTMVDYNSAAWKAGLATDAAKAVALSSAEGKNHAVNMDRAMYDAWLAYTDLQDAGYNCYVNNINTKPTSNGYLFMNMLADDQKSVDFDSIQNSIVRAVESGSYVEDFMGYEEDKFDFDFMVDGDITLKVGDVTYVTTKLDAATEGATASYEFTAPAEGATATFTLDYYYGNGTTTEKFVWTFGENVSNFTPASLTYQVELVDVEDDPTKEDVEVETNRSATLYDPDGEELGDFPIPELTKEKYYVAYEYIGEYKDVGPNPPAKAYYFAGTPVTVEGDEGYRVNDFVFSGWQDPCNDLVNGIMPAHDVTLQAYYLPMNDIVDPPIGIKTDKETEGYDYEVTIAVPGDGEKVKIHDEVILILDGSYSVDEEWEDMKKTIIAIGEKVLGGAGRTQMTVISFGMGDNIVVEGIKTVDELKEMLPALPGGLLYGRSSTNCEAGFTGALKYIESKQAELSEVDVVFISDGGINTDETPRDYSKWQQVATKFGPVTVAKEALYGTLNYGTKLPDAFYTVFGEDVDPTNFDLDAVTDAQALAFGDAVWKDVFDYSDLNRNTEHPISDAERAFVKYDKEKGTYIQDLFYYTIYKSAYDSYPNMGNRTVAAAEALAACGKVDELYLIRYANHGNGWWVKNVEGGKNYIKAENVAGLLDVIGPMTEELAQTNYTNVVITDYMSKWVNLDTNSIRIVNDTTGETIWTVAAGWLSDDIPTVKNPPVVVELVAEDDYAAGGADVVGNTNGDIYKLTWYVKDDCLLRTDNYSLRYTVTVDVAEEGFVPGVEYPANGNTYVDYENDGHNDIDVPNVAIPAYTVTYIDGQIVLQETTSLATGADIPECDEPASYTSGGYKFTFKNWELIEGTEGANDTVGTTNLVYKAVYTKSKLTSDITPTNPEGETIEILEDDIPLADIPALFGDDHFAYIIGRDDGLVHPEANITRAEVATIFFRLLADEVRTALMTGENDFSDVNEGQWYNHAVSTLSSMGIVLGRDDGTYYDPDAFITRAEFAAIAARFDSFGNPEGVFFSDIEGHWAEREIIIAANNGWVEGYNGLFRPDDYITRAEAMTLVNRVLHRLPETEDDLLDYMVIWPDNMDVDAWYYLDVQEATNSHFYERKADPVYESWTEFREPYDWSLLEY